jgi:uncharacterized protein YbbK (DUF523 family)
MISFPKPNVVISKCLGFAKCRYDGKIVLDTIVRRLKPFVNFIPVCPETEIGLGIPRDPIRIVMVKGTRHLYQPATDKDLTRQMIQFSKRYLASLKDIDGFILKSRSPSCGINRVKIYYGYRPDAKSGMGKGFFARAVKNKFPYLVVADEIRLKNPAFRKNFLIKLFSLARHRTLQRNTKENKYPSNQIFCNPFLQKLIVNLDSKKKRNK